MFFIVLLCLCFDGFIFDRISPSFVAAGKLFFMIVVNSGYMYLSICTFIL